MEKRHKVLFQQLEDYRQETLKAIDGEWFHFGTKPADWDTQPPKLAVLVSLLQEQPQKIQAAYKDRLEAEFPATESGMHTISQVLVRTIFHEGMHLASLHTIRRCLGK
ncbi:hypothetical protein B5G50_17125 [Brevibacillus brevis]|uniref:hypothetical protein n=1 Tax=Brevibacillus brevis TaxID=1393 RepID=UPI000B37EE32|nr:hypothetical protein [Brevibacillus brevis]OUQ87266.1 hypothetical protein B5G50_17125 [Brevibacillus brevis]